MRVEKTDEYREWLDELKDRTGRARILVRVNRFNQWFKPTDPEKSWQAA